MAAYVNGVRSAGDVVKNNQLAMTAARGVDNIGVNEYKVSVCA